jgi:ABC-type Fe3+/spermidine/putrescine transport system ATPase subunit
MLVTEQGQGDTIDVVLRPEDLTIVPRPPAQDGNVHDGNVHDCSTIPGRIVAMVFQGGTVEYEIDIGGDASLRVLARARADLTRGAPVWISIDTRRAAVFAR